MIVQHNLQAMNANRMLGVNTANQSKSSEKLSSGFRVNRAADDAAGLSISEKMRRQVRGLNQASANAQDGISAVQTAEGALNEVHDMLQRMNELATQAANGTLSQGDRTNVQDEITALTNEINRVATTTKFNETSLLDATKTLTLHVGADGLTSNQINVSLTAMDASTLSVDALAVNDADGSAAMAAIETIKTAINTVSTQRSALGAAQNRLEHTVKNLDNVAENTQAAESRIRDLDMAKEMVEYSKNNILAQAGQSMLAQANQATQGVLSLLR